MVAVVPVLDRLRRDSEGVGSSLVGITDACADDRRRSALGDIDAPLKLDAMLDRLRHRAARLVPGEGAVGWRTCPRGDGEGIPQVHVGEMEDLMRPPAISPSTTVSSVPP